MRYTYNALGFAFDLPPHWKQGLAVNPSYPNTTMFDCAEGEVLIIPAEIRDDLVGRESRRSALEQDFQGEGYTDIHWGTNDERLGTEANVLVARYNIGVRNGYAISAVHGVLDIEIRFECESEAFLNREVTIFMHNFKFFQVKGDVRPDQLDRSSGPSTIQEVLLAQNPDEKRRILARAGAPPSVSGRGYTMHDISQTRNRRKRWWEFWK